MIKYVIMHVDGQLSLEKNDAEINEIYAVCYDKTLHKQSDLWYISEKQQKYLQIQTYLYDNKECITNQEEYWSRLSREICQETIFIVWSQTESTMFLHMDKKMKPYKLNAQILSLKNLYRVATEIPDNAEIKIRVCMEEMGLTFHNKDSLDPFYKTDCLRRIFHKMYRKRIDKKSDQFVMSLRKKNMKRIADKLDLSFVKSYREKKQLEEIFQATVKKGFGKQIDGKKIVIETSMIHGTIQKNDSSFVFKYYTNRFYRGERERIFEFEGKQGAENMAEKLLCMIDAIESNFRYGVGSDAVTDLLERLCVGCM